MRALSEITINLFYTSNGVSEDIINNIITAAIPDPHRWEEKRYPKEAERAILFLPLPNTPQQILQEYSAFQKMQTPLSIQERASTPRPELEIPFSKKIIVVFIVPFEIPQQQSFSSFQETMARKIKSPSFYAYLNDKGEFDAEAMINIGIFGETDSLCSNLDDLIFHIKGKTAASSMPEDFSATPPPQSSDIDPEVLRQAGFTEKEIDEAYRAAERHDAQSASKPSTRPSSSEASSAPEEPTKRVVEKPEETPAFFTDDSQISNVLEEHPLPDEPDFFAPTPSIVETSIFAQPTTEERLIKLARQTFTRDIKAQITATIQTDRKIHNHIQSFSQHDIISPLGKALVAFHNIYQYFLDKVDRGSIDPKHKKRYLNFKNHIAALTNQTFETLYFKNANANFKRDITKGQWTQEYLNKLLSLQKTFDKVQPEDRQILINYFKRFLNQNNIDRLFHQTHHDHGDHHTDELQQIFQALPSSLH